MKPGQSKTRTRKTIGGGTKTVTRSRGSQGSRVRKVETTKNDGEKIIKVRRKDRSGVSKHKERTITGGNYQDFQIYREDTHTLTEKDKFRKRGSLRSESSIPRGKSRLSSKRTRQSTFHTRTTHVREEGNPENYARFTIGKTPRKKMDPKILENAEGKGHSRPYRKKSWYPSEKTTKTEDVYDKKTARQEYKKRKESLKPRMTDSQLEHYYTNRQSFKWPMQYEVRSAEARKKK